MCRSVRAQVLVEPHLALHQPADVLVVPLFPNDSPKFSGGSQDLVAGLSHTLASAQSFVFLLVGVIAAACRAALDESTLVLSVISMGVTTQYGANIIIAGGGIIFRTPSEFGRNREQYQSTL